uniref:Methyltransferase domain-containing protein n=1 Tax=Candidatus Kentrum sp. DK TaxID=2126562 RepID=A0A450SWW2_9GAMM|nr:MAG: Methyltransferase domain-containing protein [Candidatus Kentron sp. DK]
MLGKCDENKLIENIARYAIGRNKNNFDYLYLAKLLAAIESASYYQENMLLSKAVVGWKNIINDAVAAVTIDGLFLEFGVASGRTINHIASKIKTKVYGFDSFEGLPETWRTGFKKGTFVGKIPDVAENVELIVGMFEVTLPYFAMNTTENVTFLHVDCDLYSSAKTIFDNLEGKIVPGTVILFDEYLNYPGWKFGEYKAFHEFIKSAGLSYEYRSFVPDHQQVCVIIK